MSFQQYSQNMAVLRSITFEESLCEALRGLDMENISLRIDRKGATSNVVVLNKNTLIILPHHAISASFTSASRFYFLQANQWKK